MTTVSQGTQDADARVEERRRQILDAASAVFARRGYHRARTKEIAKEAGIAEGTIYNYFGSKRDLLLAIIDQVVTESIPAVCQEPDCGDLPTVLRSILADRLAMLERNSQLIKAVVPEMINDADLRRGYLEEVAAHFVSALVPIQQRALTQARPRPFNPRVVLPALAGATIAAFVFNEMADFPMGKAASREELTHELSQLFLDGLCQRAGWWAIAPPDNENTAPQPPRPDGETASHDRPPGSDGRQQG